MNLIRLLKSFIGNNFIEIDKDIYSKNFFSNDLIHFNNSGHKLISEKIIEKIEKKTKILKLIKFNIMINFINQINKKKIIFNSIKPRKILF